MQIPELKRVAESALRPRLGPLGLDHVDVAERLDHDGELAIFVTASYKEASGVPRGDTLLEAHQELQDALSAKGEARFAYLKHQFSEENSVAEEDSGADAS